MPRVKFTAAGWAALLEFRARVVDLNPCPKCGAARGYPCVRKRHDTTRLTPHRDRYT